jgi:hypothetical protein
MRILDGRARRSLADDAGGRDAERDQLRRERVGLGDAVPSFTAARDHERCLTVERRPRGSLDAAARAREELSALAEATAEDHDRVEGHSWGERSTPRTSCFRIDGKKSLATANLQH